jgi:hypothetical protein
MHKSLRIMQHTSAGGRLIDNSTSLFRHILRRIGHDDSHHHVNEAETIRFGALFTGVWMVVRGCHSREVGRGLSSLSCPGIQVHRGFGGPLFDTLDWIARELLARESLARESMVGGVFMGPRVQQPKPCPIISFKVLSRGAKFSPRSCLQ